MVGWPGLLAGAPSAFRNVGFGARSGRRSGRGLGRFCVMAGGILWMGGLGEGGVPGKGVFGRKGNGGRSGSCGCDGGLEVRGLEHVNSGRGTIDGFCSESKSGSPASRVRKAAANAAALEWEIIEVNAGGVPRMRTLQRGCGGGNAAASVRGRECCTRGVLGCKNRAGWAGLADW